MTRRTALQAAGMAAVGLQVAQAEKTSGGGRLNQSVSRWCYKNYSVDELCQHAKRIGLKGIDLISHEDWPTVQKYGLVPSMTPGSGTIPDGWNRTANHDKLVKEMEENITRAAESKVPNVITFSGNRKGQADAEGIENCAAGLNRVKKIAEEKGVTINLELLNSKVDHHDYQCDHCAWGVEVMKRVDSPRVKLLFDIYHMQIMEGDIIRTIRDNYAYLGHFHTGGVPGRHEIDGTQELNWRAVATAIADLGFKGYFAHEFVPAAKDPIASLQQAYEICKV
jgi:hydroxypyruvate isomerase